MPARLPTVFNREEVRSVLARLDGTRWLMASPLYGAGLRLMECVRLRVKDVRTTMIYTHVLDRGRERGAQPARLTLSSTRRGLATFPALRL
jgi:site-specific recombinase XerD